MRYSVFFGVALAGIITTEAAQAASVNITTSNSPVAATTALTGFTTLGDMMSGMLVTATFAGGGSQTLTWATSGSGAGGVSGSLFGLTESGDTFSSPWTLTNLSTSLLTGLSINAGAGNTTFDIVTGSEVTPGSGLGQPYADQSSLTGTIGVTYSEPLGVGGNPPLGDEYLVMAVDYTGLAGGGIAGSQVESFLQDTDNINIPGDITTVTPLPTALPLFASGLGALGLLGWRRKRKVQATA